MTAVLEVRSWAALEPGDVIVALAGEPLPARRVVAALDPELRAVVLEHPEPNPHGVEWRIYAAVIADGVEVERPSLDPGFVLWRAVGPYPGAPTSPLPETARRILLGLSPSTPTRLDLPSGVSAAALARRGLAAKVGRRGWLLTERGRRSIERRSS